MRNLKGKAILVCGGATGIGAATVRRLAEQGAQVGIGDLNIEAASALAQALRDGGAQVHAWHYDQADEASINALVNSAIETLGRLDGLFCNVADLKAVLEDGDLLTNDSAMWDRTLRINVTGTVMLMKAALPQMLEQGSGTIVLTSSDAGVVGEAERPAYAASKAAVNSLCRHVASKWGKKGIRCNVVSPGFVLTEQLEAHMPQDMTDWMLKGSRSPRHGKSEDIAGAVAFLLSDDGEWVNGQVWRVNGGVSFAN
ncbi:MAG: NAD(P)-dependent dehydrogenase (short-subunit alcohol dehydrogenase family) [Bacteroidia bacterium]|jgi:NAD(P)-dependent dehydrogenase (short-subunit alcohol dehydrogenase family)